MCLAVNAGDNQVWEFDDPGDMLWDVAGNSIPSDASFPSVHGFPLFETIRLDTALNGKNMSFLLMGAEGGEKGSKIGKRRIRENRVC